MDLRARNEVLEWFRGPAPAHTAVFPLDEDLLQAEATQREVEAQVACLSRAELENIVIRLALRSADARSAVSEAFQQCAEPAPSKKPKVLSTSDLHELCAKYNPTS